MNPLQSVASGAASVSEKALYALSTLIRNNHDGQSQFYSGHGLAVLASLLGRECSPRQLRGALDLVTDLSATEASVEVSDRIQKHTAASPYIMFMTSHGYDLCLQFVDPF